jgi:hypothetical protein
MTFKDLKKLMNNSKSLEQQSKIFDRLYNKPFWIWDIQEHKQQDARTNGDCCFNHIIGLPKKNGVEKPIFDYEKSQVTDIAIISLDKDVEFDSGNFVTLSISAVH